MTGPFRHPAVLSLIQAAIEEDLGRGDVTSRSTIEPGTRGEAVVDAKESVVVAGLPIVPVLFHEYRAPVEVDLRVKDGDRVEPGSIVAVLRGEAADLLEMERTLLNFVQRMSGIATLTARYVEAVAGTGVTIVDTRKTTPGWRHLEKYAVRVGGGRNHRFGLDDGVLIKDNHIVAAGGVADAVRRARAGVPHTIRIEVECETMEQVDEAIGAGADIVLLDNMAAADMKAAARRVHEADPRMLVEASGGITLETVREVAETGVDLISVGALTHSAPAIDLSMTLRLR